MAAVANKRRPYASPAIVGRTDKVRDTAEGRAGEIRVYEQAYEYGSAITPNRTLTRTPKSPYI